MSKRERIDRITPKQKEINPEPGSLRVPRPTRRDSHMTSNERPKKNKPLPSSPIGSKKFYFMASL